MTTPSLPASGHGEVAGLVEELRAGLTKLPAGPWQAVPRHVEEGEPVVRVYAGWVLCTTCSDDYAAHIARCSPNNIAKLIDLVDALTADGGAAMPDRGGMDGTERLCRSLYGRKATARDYLGGSDARMLHDAADRLTESLATPTPSPVEARADGVREALTRAERKLSAYIGVCDGDKELTNTVIPMVRNVLAALESTPAQPVRVGQTELDEIEAAIGATGLIIQGLGSRTIVPVAVVSRLLEMARASQPDPAAEIAKLRGYVLHWQTKCQDTRREQLEATARAERAESELAVIREAAAALLADLDRTLVFAKDDRITTATNASVKRLRAALANTADRGQEEKGNGALR